MADGDPGIDGSWSQIRFHDRNVAEATRAVTVASGLVAASDADPIGRFDLAGQGDCAAHVAPGYGVLAGLGLADDGHDHPPSTQERQQCN